MPERNKFQEIKITLDLVTRICYQSRIIQNCTCSARAYPCASIRAWITGSRGSGRLHAGGLDDP